MTTPLIALAEVADETARDQHRLARKARTMDRQRQRGWSWSTILDRESQPRLLVLLASSVRRLAEASGRFRAALAGGLVDEGLSTRQTSERLGVSHQRVSTMLHERRS